MPRQHVSKYSVPDNHTTWTIDEDKAEDFIEQLTELFFDAVSDQFVTDLPPPIAEAIARRLLDIADDSGIEPDDQRKALKGACRILLAHRPTC